MNPYEKFLDEFLLQRKYVLAQDLNQEIQKRFKNVQAPNGRQIIGRAVDSRAICRSPITFGKNQYAYAHSTKPFDWDLILEIAAQHRPSLYRVILMLDLFQGVLSQYEAQKIAACPLDDELSRNDSIDKIFKEIVMLGHATQVSNDEGVRFLVYPHLAQNVQGRLAKEIRRMSMDAMFIPDILRALQRFNIISSNNVLYRRKMKPHLGVNHNNFCWDAIGYTKTTGINEGRASEANNIKKQTLVVIDIVISRRYTDNDLQGFLRRIQGITSSVKTGRRKVLPIVVYAGIESKILINRIRTLGFLSFDIGTIYGTNIYRVIECVQSSKQIKDFSDGTIDAVVEEALDLIGKSGQEDNLSNIKGDLFESLMFPVLQTLVPGADIEPSRELKTIEEGRTIKYEYDYILRSSRLREIVIVELKGYPSTKYIGLGNAETKNSIKWFFSNTLPFAQRELTKIDAGYKISGCYITTADFSPEGAEHLQTLQDSRIKPTEMDVFYNGEKLTNLLEQKNLHKILGIIRKYYIKPEFSNTRVPFSPDEGSDDELDDSSSIDGLLKDF